jgi:hypothetical protein
VIKARNRKLSIILVLAMLMTMFAGVGTASANTTTYSCLQVPYLANNTTVSSNVGTLGTIVIDWKTLTNVAPHSAIMVLPDGLELTGSSVYYATFVKGVDDTLITSPSDPSPIALTKISDKEIRIDVPTNFGGKAVTGTDVRAQIGFVNIKVSDGAPAGEAKVKFLNIAGLFPPGEVTIGNVVGAGAASVSVIDTKTITGGSTTTVEFTVQESTKEAVKKEAKALTFKLPRGFTWDADPIVKDLTTNTDPAPSLTTSRSDDKRTFYVNRTADNLERSLFKITAQVKVDETVAAFGDVMVTVSGKNSVTPGEVKIGSFADYGYTITVEDPEKEILAGRSAADSATQDEAELSAFFIAENIDGSLLNDRTIYMQLPEGVQWYSEELAAAAGGKSIADQISDNIIQSKENGGITIEFTPIENKPGLLKGTFKNLDTSKDKIKIRAKVLVAVDFEGDIEIEFSGSQGINDTITVAKVIKPVTASADIVDVKIGMQAQEAGDILITEVKPETFIHANRATLRVAAPAGVSFYELPEVEVTEGDLLLGTPTLAIGADGTRNNVLVIPIRSSSDKVSTIKISNVSYSLDRTVPEGELVLDIEGSALDRAGILNRTTAATIVAANCVTPAPGDTVGSCEFRIGSNIYYEGGVAKVMNVAPYIKGDRTYVPMRYMGEALGAEVEWDEAARKVTLNKDEITVEFTIGSTTYTVNNEAKTADVAPEITNDRTMLPARFVAEAFGAVVGWDAATQTVLIQK